MGTSPEITPTVASSFERATVVRAQAIARAWMLLGDGVAPLSNGSGRPLARTMKLIVDPLVIRPVQNPHLAGHSMTASAAEELAGRIAAAEADLAATAEWFLALKRARRSVGITEGNPQEKYFQRCFELARTLGRPDPATADDIATRTVSDIAQAGGDALMTRIREVLQDPLEAERLHKQLTDLWRRKQPPAEDRDPTALLTAILDACGTTVTPELPVLINARVGSTGSVTLEGPGTARALGLTELDRPAMPDIGASASKRALPRPFDRSVFERLFAALSGGSGQAEGQHAADVIEDEIARTAAAWQLTDEGSRAIMSLGTEASHALEPTELLHPTNAHRLLQARWQREAYVRRVLRLPGEISGVPESIRDDIHAVRQAYLRRLWVRLHGRELRGIRTSADEVWDTLDGVLRSVIMDQRHRLKLAIGRETEDAA